MSEPSVLGQLARSFAMISLIAIGGINAVLPALRDVVVESMLLMDD